MKDIFNECASLLKRSPSAHKGSFGHILIIGGDHGMGGAVIMAAEAAAKIGAGKVSVFTHPQHIAPLLARIPSVMSVQISSDLEKMLIDKTVIAIGPGLGQSNWSRQLFNQAMRSNLPKVIDADALNLLALSGEEYNLENAILTPHPGEAARLLDVSVSEIQADRVLAVKKIAEIYETTVVLKGNGSLICDEEKIVYTCPYGNAGMATAGMGDVLSGVIAGLLAQKLDCQSAAFYGTHIHAYAADLVAQKQGQVGMVATDLLPFFPLIVNGKL